MQDSSFLISSGHSLGKKLNPRSTPRCPWLLCMGWKSGSVGIGCSTIPFTLFFRGKSSYRDEVFWLLGQNTFYNHKRLKWEDAERNKQQSLCLSDLYLCYLWGVRTEKVQFLTKNQREEGETIDNWGRGKGWVILALSIARMQQSGEAWINSPHIPSTPTQPRGVSGCTG